MKAVLVLLFLIGYIQCRKTYAPIDKNANQAFINIEGGGSRPAPNAAKPVPAGPVPPPAKPLNQPPNQPINKPVVTPITIKPTPVKPAQPSSPVHPTPSKPVTPASPVRPSAPVRPGQQVNPSITTPGPGSVKSLVNFYDSQGKGSVIRPYSYSQAVKQG